MPPILASAVDHAMQAKDMDAHVAFCYEGANDQVERDAQIGVMLVNGRRAYFAAIAARVCFLDGPLQFDWTAQCPIVGLLIEMGIQ